MEPASHPTFYVTASGAVDVGTAPEGAVVIDHQYGAPFARRALTAAVLAALVRLHECGGRVTDPEYAALGASVAASVFRRAS
jgi:hypothetical protein